jgi:hypothetical protein
MLARVSGVILAAFASAMMALVLVPGQARAQTALLLPNAQQQFIDYNGAPLAGGWVYMYVPGTTTPSLTWQDINLTVPNTNPIHLDSAGYARIWGQGAAYRQVVTRADSTLVWDQVTSTFNPGAIVGNASITGNLTVSGTVGVGTDLGVSGNEAIAGSLAVSGLATFGAGMEIVAGGLLVDNGLTVVGATALNTLAVNGLATFGAGLEVVTGAAIVDHGLTHACVPFGSLPAGLQGTVACVTNSSVITWGGTADGAGASPVLVWYNGAIWSVIGI